jgi:hypothetical protein
LKWTSENVIKIQTMLNLKYINSILVDILPVVDTSDDYSMSPITISNEDWLDWAENNGITTMIPEDVDNYMVVKGAGPCKSDLFIPNEIAARALILGYLP